jgi:hypothetical protein
MTNQQESSKSAIESFNSLINHLSGVIAEDHRQSRDVIRRMWGFKTLNNHVTMQQCRFGLAWVKGILGSDFRTDGNYEKSITGLVQQLNNWPDNKGEPQALTYEEKKRVKLD